MGQQTWGSLDKSSTDDTKIDTAISDAIALHNADPSAHLGADGSLLAHKSDTTIDHPAFSVVADKFSPEKPLFQTLFESIDGWYTHGNHYNSLLVLRVGLYGDQVGDSYAYNEGIEFAEDDSDYTILDNMYQLKFSISNYNNIGDIYFGLGVQDAVPVGGNELCWKIIGTTIYSGFGAEGTISWVSHGTISEIVRHTVSVVSSKATQEVYFYLDGQLVRTVSISSMSEPYFDIYGIYVHKTGGTTNAQSCFFYQQYLMWSAGTKT